MKTFFFVFNKLNSIASVTIPDTNQVIKISNTNWSKGLSKVRKPKQQKSKIKLKLVLFLVVVLAFR